MSAEDGSRKIDAARHFQEELDEDEQYRMAITKLVNTIAGTGNDADVGILEATWLALDRFDDLVERVERLEDVVDDVPSVQDHRDIEDRAFAEYRKLARRLAALEEEVGVDPSTANVIAQGDDGSGQMTKLGRLIEFGPAAVETKKSTERLKRARTIVENWETWGNTRRIDDDTLEMSLSSRRDDLKIRLEAACDESLAWKQVYRAMETVAEFSEGVINFRDTGRGGKRLVRRLERGGSA